MNKIALLSVIASGALLFTGCATLFGGGGKQVISINIDSDKRAKGVVKYEDDNKTVQQFNAPATINVERRKSNIILTSTDNSFHETTVKSDVNGWFWVNILGAPGGTLISSTTDSASGAMWKYDDTVNLVSK